MWYNKPEIEIILCASVWVKDKDIRFECNPINIDYGYVFCGHRHGICMEMASKLIPNIDDCLANKSVIQGFITNMDRFVDRNEAGKIALKAGQIDSYSETLISEELY